MTVRATKFTPEVMLSAPRRSAGIPNADGSKVLYSVSAYSFAEHSKKSEIRVLDVKTQETTLVTDDAAASDKLWIGDSIIVLFSGEDGVTEVRIGKAVDFAKSSYTAGTFSGPVSDLELQKLSSSVYGLAVSGKATPSGDLFNPTKAPKPLSTGRLYKSTFVRHWDHYVTENRNSIFVATLTKEHEDGKFELSKPRNALKGTGLESPIEPFGGTDHFDIAKCGLMFTAKDPELPPGMHTKTNIYLINDENFWDTSSAVPKPAQVNIEGFAGASTSPVFSPSGKSLAFLSMRKDGYESDKNHVFIMHDITKLSELVQPYSTHDGNGTWNRSPQSIIWRPDEKDMYFIAEDRGRSSLFQANVYHPFPTVLVKGGAISDVQVLENGDLFISSTSLIDNSLYSLLPDAEARSEPPRSFSLPDGITTENKTQLISSYSQHGSKFGLTRNQIDEIHWPGAANGETHAEWVRKIHAWVVRPSNFDPKKKYPLAYLIHGGPQGAWQDAWSTRWNPAIFAEQGYIAICPNPTGSTGYGQAFTDAITGEWGGLPYEDLVKGFEWIESNMPYVDTSRAVALGASYGGYMMNWIQGHPLGRKFRALVTHDGVFSMTSQLASEELYFPFHDLSGPLWKNPEAWAKWDPSRFTEHWSTPHLIIHSELDYRLTMTEGLAAFHTLQARGVESQFLVFQDENHWVLKPENSLVWHRTVLDWINGHVGLPKYSDGGEEGREA